MASGGVERDDGRFDDVVLGIACEPGERVTHRQDPRRPRGGDPQLPHPRRRIAVESAAGVSGSGGGQRHQRMRGAMPVARRLRVSAVGKRVIQIRHGLGVVPA